MKNLRGGEKNLLRKARPSKPPEVPGGTSSLAREGPSVVTSCGGPLSTNADVEGSDWLSHMMRWRGSSLRNRDSLKT